MERLGTCGVCEHYSSKVDYSDCSEGKCFVGGPVGTKWTTSRDTCAKHSEDREIAVMELTRGLEEVQARIKGWRQRIEDCEKRIHEDKILISEVEPREAELIAALEGRGVACECYEDEDDD